MKKSEETTGRRSKADGRTSSAEENSSKLNEFFHDELKDIYWAEKHLVKALPKMQKAASSEELQNAIADHLEQTKEHVSRLENIFEMLGHKVQAKKCDAMDGLTKEGQKIIEDTDDDTATRDVGIIMSAQKVEHYEIATYGTLVQLAKTIGNNGVADLLEKTLQEEKDTDRLLTEIAENNINYESAQEPQEA